MKNSYKFNQAVKGLFWKLILMSWLLLITGCMSKETLVNELSLSKLFHSNTNCNAPCWQNISPGNSKVEDVEQMILTMSEQELQSYQRTEVEPDFVWYSWYNETERLFVNISIFRGVVDFINLTPTMSRLVPFDVSLLTPSPNNTVEPHDQNQSYYTLADIFQIVGEPFEYSALLSTDYHGTKILSLLLFYKSGIIIDKVYVEGQQDGFDFGNIEGCNVKISLDSYIQRLYFTNITTLSDTLPDRGNRLSFFNGDIYTWDGVDNIRLSKCNK